MCILILQDILNENQEGGPLLPRQEADMVFGKLIHIYQLHKGLQVRLAELEGSWNMETSRLGEILLPLIDEMEKVSPCIPVFLLKCQILIQGMCFTSFFKCTICPVISLILHPPPPLLVLVRLK